MKRYEELQNKANRCWQAAHDAPGKVMQEIWARHAEALEEKAAALSIAEAQAEAYQKEKDLQGF